MKFPIYIALLIGSFCLCSCGTPKSVAGFYQKHKRKKGVRNVKLPGWVIWAGTGIAHDIAKDEDVKTALRFAKKIKKLRFMLAEEENAIPPEEIQSFVENIKAEDYEDLIFVKDGDTKVNMLIKDKNEKLKDMVFLVNTEEEFVFFSMKSNIKYEDVTNLVKSLTSELFGEEKRPMPEKRKRKKKVPQA